MKRRISWRRLALVLSLLSMLAGPIWVTAWQDDQAKQIYSLTSDSCTRKSVERATKNYMDGGAAIDKDATNCFHEGWKARTEFIEGNEESYHKDMILTAIAPSILFWLCVLILWCLYRAITVRKP